MPTRAKMTSLPRLLPRTMPGSLVLLRPEPMLIFLAYDTTKGQKEVQDLNSHIGPSTHDATGSLPF